MTVRIDTIRAIESAAQTAGKANPREPGDPMAPTILLRLPASVLEDKETALQAACCGVLGYFYDYPPCCIEAFVQDVATIGAWTRERVMHPESGHIMCEACRVALS